MLASTLEDSEILVLLSGGIDSTACLNFYVELSLPVCALFIDYKQPALQYEYDAAQAVAAHYKLPLIKGEWNGMLHSEPGYIQSRNLFLLSAALLEAPKSITAISIGIHAGTEYADCSPEFIAATQNIFDIYTGSKIHITAPFITWHKQDILQYVSDNNVPTHMTYSCEAGLKSGCGKCLSCLDRELLKDYA